MSLDRPDKISSLTIVDGDWACPGFRVAEATGTWSYVSSTTTGLSVLQSGTGIALSEILQGDALFESSGTYGTETTMPNQQSPLINVCYNIDTTSIYKIVDVINDTTIVVEDPQGLADGISGNNIYLTCSRFAPPTKMIFSGVGTIGISTLDGTIISSGITLPHEIEAEEGSVLEPVLIRAVSGDLVVTIIR